MHACTLLKVTNCQVMTICFEAAIFGSCQICKVKVSECTLMIADEVKLALLKMAIK